MFHGWFYTKLGFVDVEPFGNKQDCVLYKGDLFMPVMTRDWVAANLGGKDAVMCLVGKKILLCGKLRNDFHSVAVLVK